MMLPSCPPGLSPGIAGKLLSRELLISAECGASFCLLNGYASGDTQPPPQLAREASAGL